MGIALITKDYENTVGKRRMPVIVEFTHHGVQSAE